MLDTLGSWWSIIEVVISELLHQSLLLLYFLHDSTPSNDRDCLGENPWAHYTTMSCVLWCWHPMWCSTSLWRPCFSHFPFSGGHFLKLSMVISKLRMIDDSPILSPISRKMKSQDAAPVTRSFINLALESFWTAHVVHLLRQVRDWAPWSKGSTWIEMRKERCWIYWRGNLIQSCQWDFSLTCGGLERIIPLSWWVLYQVQRCNAFILCIRLITGMVGVSAELMHLFLLLGFCVWYDHWSNMIAVNRLNWVILIFGYSL